MRDVHGKTVTLRVQRHDTVADIKARLEVKVETPANMQILSYRTKDLLEHNTLEHYRIRHNCTLDFAGAFKGQHMSLNRISDNRERGKERKRDAQTERERSV